MSLVRGGVLCVCDGYGRDYRESRSLPSKVICNFIVLNIVMDLNFLDVLPQWGTGGILEKMCDKI